jgi:hypothetical protein
MDIQKFRDSREEELNAFQKQYDFLKKEYSSVLMSAIKESDPAQQQELIQQVLTINSSMASELRDIIAKLNQGAKGFNPRELNDLTNDLIQYQKDYKEIEQSKDKVNTLKRIRESNETKLKTATTLYNIYIAVFIALSFIVAYLVYKTEIARKLSATLPRVLSR